MLKRISCLLLSLLIVSCGETDAPPPPKSAAELAYIDDASPVAKAMLDEAIAPLFDDPELGDTRALIILYRGEPLVEKYGEGYGPDSRFIGWSVAKSITAALVGMLVADGRLVLDDPAPVPEWRRPGDPRGGITLRQLLHMSSGLDHQESGSAEVPIEEADTNRMLFLDGAQDMAGYARAKPPEAPPGEKFEYSTATTMILADIVTRPPAGSDVPQIRHHAAQRFIRGRLFEPLGMTSARFEYDAAGTFIGGSMFVATARDYATFGEFLRHKGAKAGAQHLPVGWIDFMRRPSDTDPAYGGHLWLNRPRPDGRPPVLFPGMGPDSLFAALGHLGQYVIVSPDQKLTIVRLGKTDTERQSGVTAQLGRIVALFPVDD